MKMWNFLYTMFGVACIIASCTSSIPGSKNNFSESAERRTYSWAETKTDPADKLPRPIAYADKGMRAEVNNQLTKLGWQEVSNDPELLLSYDVLIQKTPEMVNGPINSNPLKTFYFNPVTDRWVSISFPAQFDNYQVYEIPPKEGTVILTITDAKTDQLIRQVWTVQKMNYTRFKQKGITTTVRNMINKLTRHVTDSPKLALTD
jgi:hypothetical protein